VGITGLLRFLSHDLDVSARAALVARRKKWCGPGVERGVNVTCATAPGAAGHGVPDRVLYERMEANLVASWATYTAGSAGAGVERVPGAVVAVFPSLPERVVYNNALLARDLDVDGAGYAITTTQAMYADAGIEGYAVWVHESDRAAIGVLDERGYRAGTATRAMALSLDTITVPRPQLMLGPGDWDQYLRILEVPDGLLAGTDPGSFHVRIVTDGGDNVAAAMAYDHAGDCGIYNVVTVPHARRRGLGTALTALLVHEARDRGCATASLQATEVAERLYASVGFCDLGRLLEYVM
jgi:ribosomal protein S18 acetylase RimI-like enzyme